MGAFNAISVNSLFRGDFPREHFWATFYLQHRGPEFSGLAMLDEKGEMLLKTHKGWFRPAFQEDLDGFYGPLGIGHISAKSPEPVRISSTFPDICLCFVGNVINREELWQELKESGQVMSGELQDASLISRLIVAALWREEKTIEENFICGINKMAQKIKGAFAIAIMTEHKIFVVRGLDGHQVVTLGEKEGAVIAASESCGFYNLGYKFLRELKPGEIVSLQNGKETSLGIINSSKDKQDRPCSFNWVYTANAASIIFGTTVKNARQELGARLARRDIAAGFFPDYVMPIKDSGGYATIGYLNEFIRQARAGKIDKSKIPLYDEGLIRFIYAGRSFTPSDEEVRKEEAGIKQIPIPDPAYNGLKVAIVDDSIVTGNQFKRDLVPKVRYCGFAQVHARISFPPLVSICPWGKANKRKKKLAAINGDDGIKSEIEIAQFLGLDSCQFNQISDVAEAIGIPKDSLCLDCAIPS